MKRIIYFDDFIVEKSDKYPCWNGYTQVGTKEKYGKEVPNCVTNKDKKIKKQNESRFSNFYYFKLNETKEKDPRLKSAGVESYNKPKRTPDHPTKSHIVVAKEGDKIKTIRFGEQGAKTAGKPKKGESDKMKNKRKSFKARHAKNIKKGKMSAAYWADKVKW